MTEPNAPIKIRTPEGPRLDELCDMLGRVFAVEEKLFDEVKAGRVTLRSWTPYAGYLDGVLVANVALIDMQVWWGGRVLDLAGVASVATVPRFRRRGYARRLMDHAMQVVDDKRIPAVLFTDVPAVYTGHGFHVIDQPYRAVRLQGNPFDRSADEPEVVDHVGADLFEAMQQLHQQDVPAYDGKPIRPDYTRSFQRFLFNDSRNTRVLLARREGGLAGWLRWEVGKDRITLTDIAASRWRPEVVQGLLHALVEHESKDLMSVALPEAHPVWPVIESTGLTPEPEPPTTRETFMVRPRAGGPADELDTLLWSLADRF